MEGQTLTVWRGKAWLRLKAGGLEVLGVPAEGKMEAVGQQGLSKKYTETEGGGETRPEGPNGR